MFDCINARPKLSSGELGLKHFLYYFRMGSSYGNNRPVRLSAKKRKTNQIKADKGKGKANKPEDPNMYAKL